MARHLREPQYKVKVRSKREKQRLENVRAYYLTGAFKFDELAKRLAREHELSEQEAMDFLMGWAELEV